MLGDYPTLPKLLKVQRKMEMIVKFYLATGFWNLDLD